MPPRIRSAEPSDAGSIQRIYAPYVANHATSFEVDVPDVAEIARRIATLSEQYPWLVLEDGGRVMGYAYASSHRTRQAYQWCVEVSAYVDVSVHRRGVGRALYTALFELLRRQGYVNAYAGITLPNASSVALHEALGFERVGVYSRIGFKFGQWHDVLWLQLRLRDDPSPRDPVRLADACDATAAAAIFESCARSVRTDEFA